LVFYIVIDVLFFLSSAFDGKQETVVRHRLVADIINIDRYSSVHYAHGPHVVADRICLYIRQLFRNLQAESVYGVLSDFPDYIVPSNRFSKYGA